MAKYRRITVNIPEGVAAQLDAVVELGEAQSTSDYVTRSVISSLARDENHAEAGAALARMIEEAGGVTPEAETWADSVLGLDESTHTECQDDVKSAA